MTGDIIKKLRLKKELSQEDLGKIVGLTTSSIGMYETNVRKPSYEVLKKMADYFNCSTDYLLERTDDPNTKILDKDQIPNELFELGIERVEIVKEAEGLTNDELKDLINMGKRMKGIT